MFEEKDRLKPVAALLATPLRGRLTRNKKTGRHGPVLKRFFVVSKKRTGTPERIRTSDLWLRKPTLYPTELQARSWKTYMAEGRDSNPARAYTLLTV